MLQAAAKFANFFVSKEEKAKDEEKQEDSHSGPFQKIEVKCSMSTDS